MYGPVIQGGSFRLRPPRLEDAEAMATWLDDLEVSERLGRRDPYTVDEEHAWLTARATDPNSIIWTLEHEGRVVGTSGIDVIDWSHLRGKTGTLIGDKTAWRKRIAGESMRLRARFAFTQTPLNKLSSGYVEGNVASQRAQAGAGYREIGRHRQHFFRSGRWLDLVLTELLRDDWAAVAPDRG